MKKNNLTAGFIVLIAAIFCFNYGFGEFDLAQLIPFGHNKPLDISEPLYTDTDTYETPSEQSTYKNTAFPEIKTERKFDFSKTITINTPEEFFDCLTEARNSLVTSINIKMTDYNDDDYNIHKLERGKYSLSAEGKSIGTIAYMTYTFNFSDSYAICRACEDETLIPALSEEQQLSIKKLYAIKELLIKDGMSDYEKELALHDYIVKNFEYDTSAAEQDEISDSSTSITCFLCEHKGVCEAYAYTFKALCSLCGLKCYVVSGKLDNVNHAWNIIELDGSFYHIDLTSDDPLPDIPQHCFYTYFNLTDAEISKTHVYENAQYKCTNDKYNYFKYNGLIVTDYSSLYDLSAERLSRGYDTIVFKKSGYNLTTDNINDLLSGKGYTSYTITGDLSDPNADHEITLKK